jgi:Ca2+-binding EF-hand superfamily protein
MRTLLLLTLLAAGAAFAQEKKEDSASAGATAPRPNFGSQRNDVASQALFDRLDKNRDGYLTGTELTTGDALSANWLAVDRDTDGRISRAEFSVVESSGEVARK